MKSSEAGALLGIGDAAARFGLPTHVLRHWEAVGLVTPARDGAGRRRYGTGDLTRVAVAVRAKQAGLGLDTIRVLVAAADPAERRAVLVGEAVRLRTRIAAAQASLDLVECALGCGQDDFTRCPHYRTHMALGL
ncbi:MerR family transcriptional regulator [Streptomyces sp. NPDC059153]|uniref:helix-turn-helix domain-containing protein n=1 Tax=Streptomyces sp. NPDC059153 TaxID=3346743 RepID=UPI0036761DE2